MSAGVLLVTGATGNVGSAALAALRADGVPLRAAVFATPVSGVPSVALDFTRRETWGPALEGVDRLFLVRPPALSDVRRTLVPFLDFARQQLQHVVFLSVVGADAHRFIPHAKIEAWLVRSGIPYTFLRAGFFAQNLTGPYRDDIRDDDRLYVPAGDGRVAWVDTRDLGEAAARAFADPAGRNVAWTLTGGESIGFREVAAVLSEELGRPIRYDAAGLPGYLRHLLRKRGQPFGQAVVFAVLHLAIRSGGQGEVDPTLARVLGRPPRTIRDTVRDHVRLWQPDGPISDRARPTRR